MAQRGRTTRRAAHIQKKPTLSPLRRAGRIFYCLLVTLSAVIVVTYAGLRIAARPPEQAEEPAPPVLEGQSTPLPGESSQPEASQEPAMERKEFTYTFLLVASDQVSGNTDTMMVLTYDTVNQTAGLVSLPRDTMIDGVKQSDGSHFYKLNGAYAYNGIQGLKSEVSKLLGIPIDFYVKVNTRGFVRLVDAIGGVDFYVPVNMNYEDPVQDLYIHINKGMQWLSGTDALKVARCRQNSYYDESDGKWKTVPVYADSDIGRTETQRNLLTTVLKKALSQPQNLPTYYDIFLENVETDLEMGDLLYFAEKALYFDFSSNLTTSVLPGDGTVKYHGIDWCYELYPDQLLELINTQGINPYTTDITADMLTIAQKN
ncbi:LCP family protein [uncultured Flavonifractor sp.]|uniref:LCP family protein n=1 Tax=uncultured Flavonifractor sp. TaxID=1193534 RepID=UPI00260BB0BC|nr:LCP family protein [uncultured Flavonifractor sp.]